MLEAPHFPIIYLRGYAGSSGDIEDTVSTPYMGFNRGSTRIRQIHTGKVQSHVFESPLIRLMKDHKYKDAYREGKILPQGPIPSRSIWIFRYYDIADKEFGEGERREIEFHAKALREFLLHIRGAVLDENDNQEDFRAYLVAHSMGGLICRCYLQNASIPDLDSDRASGDWRKKGVDKVFTYATPHGGIKFRRGLGWAEGLRDFLDPNNAGNFGPRRMREFLDLPKEKQLNSLNGRFPEERFFCLIGTDSRDYGAALGLSKRAVGPLSDGLVRIQNATVRNAPRAFVHRSHSGHYGIVNSESGYQNLRRFLFGDLRVLVEMIDVEVSLPASVEREVEDRHLVKASYHIDTIFSVRGVPVELNRRTYDEESAIFKSYSDLTKKPTKLFTAFLMRRARVKCGRQSLGFGLRLHVRVPEYEVKGSPFVDDHYEGGTIFADKLNLEVTSEADGEVRIKYGWDSRTPNRTTRIVKPLRQDTDSEVPGQIGTIAFGRKNVRPSIAGHIRFTATPWNSIST